MTKTTLIWWTVCRPEANTSHGLMPNQFTKFEAFSISRSRDIIGALKISNGSRDVIVPFSVIVCKL